MSKKLNMKKCLAVGALSLTAILTGTSGMMSNITTPVYAAEPTESMIPTPAGVATMGKGTASIKIKNYNGQSLMGKRFTVYKLFDAENARYGIH